MNIAKELYRIASLLVGADDEQNQYWAIEEVYEIGDFTKWLESNTEHLEDLTKQLALLNSPASTRFVDALKELKEDVNLESIEDGLSKEGKKSLEKFNTKNWKVLEDARHDIDREKENKKKQQEEAKQQEAEPEMPPLQL